VSLWRQVRRFEARRRDCRRERGNGKKRGRTALFRVDTRCATVSGSVKLPRGSSEGLENA